MVCAVCVSTGWWGGSVVGGQCGGADVRPKFSQSRDLR